MFIIRHSDLLADEYVMNLIGRLASIDDDLAGLPEDGDRRTRCALEQRYEVIADEALRQLINRHRWFLGDGRALR